MTILDLKSARDVAGVKMFEICREMNASGLLTVDPEYHLRTLALMHEMICRQLDSQAKDRSETIRFEFIQDVIRMLEVMSRCESLCGESLREPLNSLRIFLEEGGAS